jgi:CspA family cold shock protein
MATKTGFIKKVHEKGFGFIAPSDGPPDIWFHASDLVDLSFGEHLKELHVEFVDFSTEKGPRATSVRALD